MAKVVRLEGFAPSRTKALVPKTSVSTDSTIGGLKMACRPSAALSLVGFGDPPAQAGARHKKCDRPELHRDPLNGNQKVCSLTYDRKSQKEQDTYRVQLRTAGQFPLAVFQALQEARSPVKLKNPTLTC